MVTIVMEALQALVRIYQFINNDWTQIGQNIYGDTSSSGSTGNAIALNNTGHRILIGFYYNDDNGSNTGVSYL